MDLLALDDPVFVIELTPAALERCRRELAGEEEVPAGESSSTTIKALPERPVRAVALLLEEGDPLLLSIPPTRDMESLDAAARLVRAAVVTGRSIAELATDFGDTRLRELYFRRRLPGFIYEGVSEELALLLPPPVRTIFAARRRGASE